MGNDVLGFDQIDLSQVALVGGKGAQLGELSRIEGVRVPPGFCITTAVFRRIMSASASLGDRLDQLSRLEPDDREKIRALSSEIRRAIEEAAIPDDLVQAITHQLARLGEHVAWAVRSSATAEDLPTASFAGQQDTYLNVVGREVDPPTYPSLLGLTLHRAGRVVSPAERLRSPKSPHGRRRAADALS